MYIKYVYIYIHIYQLINSLIKVLADVGCGCGLIFPCIPPPPKDAAGIASIHVLKSSYIQCGTYLDNFTSYMLILY